LLRQLHFVPIPSSSTTHLKERAWRMKHPTVDPTSEGLFSKKLKLLNG
jgi:hypothetical protein